MLVLSRVAGESIVIGKGADQITLVVISADRGKIRLGIEAPRDVKIYRSELLDDEGNLIPQRRGLMGVCVIHQGGRNKPYMAACISADTGRICDPRNWDTHQSAEAAVTDLARQLRGE